MNRDRRALAHRERLARVAFVTRGRHCDVADGDLPRTDELIARDKTADRAVADVNQERLVGDGRKREHAIDGRREAQLIAPPLGRP